MARGMSTNFKSFLSVLTGTVEMDTRLVIALAGFVVGFNNLKRRRVWVKKYRRKFGHLPMLKEIRENYPEDFKNYLRMDGDNFDCLLELIRHRITKQDTVMRKCITPEERLSATLRYLATGRSFEDLKFSSGISTSALSKIIPETCKAIYETLRKDYMRFPTSKEEWLEIAKGFHDHWNFVNCGGALDGKHIRIIPPANSGAKYYNYKNFYSMVLMALVDSNYEFIFVDVGKNGRMSDGGVIEYTTFYNKLLRGQLNLPERSENDHYLNYVFIGDEGFALNENLLTPYPQRELDHEKRIFNYRLSRARNVVENTFGIIASRFQILRTPINMKPENICYIVLAICSIHNFLRKRSNFYMSASTVDRENIESSTVLDGDWRQNSSELTPLDRYSARNVPSLAKQSRDEYKTYFNTIGKVSWQETMINAGRS
ncbi:protein ALP1-like [Pieris napi]|nr:protein ALP1-like [Pieris napi]